MKNLSYTNVNGDTVLITVINDNLVAVYLFGFNIVGRLTEQQKQYVLGLVQS